MAQGFDTDQLNWDQTGPSSILPPIRAGWCEILATLWYSISLQSNCYSLVTYFAACSVQATPKLTDDPAISLEDLLHVDLVDLEGVEVADEDPGVDGVRVLRARLVAHLADVHGGGGGGGGGHGDTTLQRYCGEGLQSSRICFCPLLFSFLPNICASLSSFSPDLLLLLRNIGI